MSRSRPEKAQKSNLGHMSQITVCSIFSFISSTILQRSFERWRWKSQGANLKKNENFGSDPEIFEHDSMKYVTRQGSWERVQMNAGIFWEERWTQNALCNKSRYWFMPRSPELQKLQSLYIRQNGLATKSLIGKKVFGKKALKTTVYCLDSRL